MCLIKSQWKPNKYKRVEKISNDAIKMKIYDDFFLGEDTFKKFVTKYLFRSEEEQLYSRKYSKLALNWFADERESKNNTVSFPWETRSYFCFCLYRFSYISTQRCVFQIFVYNFRLYYVDLICLLIKSFFFFVNLIVSNLHQIGSVQH